ncbi:Ornithine carbamoyltransferase [Lentibacillus sp. JNUCC-1]|uniref:ornithine carbamoyltransferase n=1 Tax=Lentibacillus sp. JNUCC-1 TaxID=2654513 RepID=UPI00132850EA|nr:ornithine carbamoyltransferase [Lentibacillus sp. JNUCC-1]MUV38835.1 Ornithine carbamoyltransferase [Lentibacillus sp. JNUCC-1]
MTVKNMAALYGRSFLTLKDFSQEEICELVDFAKALKDMKKAGKPHRYLEGQNIALLFDKPSTRTRSAFTAACVDLGAHPEHLGKGDIQFGKKESVRDTATVLGRIFDGIQYRGFEHRTIETLAANANVPVWNGLTDIYHPTQVLADFLTIEENIGHLKTRRLVYVGDGRNNMATSLLIGCAKLGMDIRICAPGPLQPDEEILAYANRIADESGGRVMVTADVASAVKGVDVIYTDVWVSMGEEEQLEERINLLRPYQVNWAMLDATGNQDVLFLHCLPAHHDLETEVGKIVYEKYGLTEMEVTDDVFHSSHSVVFDQAENRLHTIKALMAATNGDFSGG